MLEATRRGDQRFAGVVVGLGCALLSALGTNLAFLLKYKGASRLPTWTCAIRCAARSISFALSDGASAGAWRHQGEALWRVANRSFLVYHVLSDIEQRLVDTERDARTRSRA
jgi:hypothetical protein